MSTSPTSNTTGARPARRTLNLSITPGTSLDRALSLSGDRDLVRTISAMLDRYFAILHRTAPKFSEQELCAIIDALGDRWDATPANVWNIPREVMNAITADRLDAKWDIDPDTLRPRLDRTAFAERVALAEYANGYWQIATPNSYPQDVIHQLSELIQAPESRPTENARPRRVSASAYHEGAVRDTRPSQPNDDTGPSDSTNDPEDPDAVRTELQDSTGADGPEGNGNVTAPRTGQDDNPGTVGSEEDEGPGNAADPSPQDPLL